MQKYIYPAQVGDYLLCCTDRGYCLFGSGALMDVHANGLNDGVRFVHYLYWKAAAAENEAERLEYLTYAEDCESLVKIISLDYAEKRRETEIIR